MDKFKVGDKVKLVRINSEGPWYKKYLGNVYTIKNFETDNYGRFAIFKETSDVMPYVKNLELVKEEYTYEDLKKSPIGTKITFEKGIILVKTTEKRLESGLRFTSIENLKKLKDEYYGTIIKIEEPTYQTVYEANPEILDETEKRYLKDVIRPFRDKVKYIAKYHSTTIYEECILIHISNNPNIMLPYFKEDSMYKGMESGKEYTLEELGL